MTIPSTLLYRASIKLVTCNSTVQAKRIDTISGVNAHKDGNNITRRGAAEENVKLYYV